MTKRRYILLGVLAGVLLAGMAAYFNREPLFLNYLNSRTEKVSLAEHIDFMREGVAVRLPENTAPPHPVVMQLHGCAGIRPPFHEGWAKIANEMGYAAVIVDSMGPRDISWDKALETVCDGETLIGQERAGDILAAIKIIEERNDLDTERLVVAGWSHGGWTTMDFLTMDFDKKWPANLRHEPVDIPKIGGVILFYPYCGVGTLSRVRGWVDAPPVLALIAGEDTIVDANECVDLLNKAAAKGETIDLQVYPNARHVFDDQFLDPEYLDLYNADYHADAVKRYRQFLSGVTVRMSSHQE